MPETQPSLMIFAQDYVLNLHIENQKESDQWFSYIADSRTYALQKQKMNDQCKETPHGSLKRVDSRWTLKRKRAPTTPADLVMATSEADEVVTANPLFGLQHKALPRRMAPHLFADEGMKKSPSLNTIEPPNRRASQFGRGSMDSEGSDQVRALMARKSVGFSRSSSINVMKSTPKPGDN